MARLFKELLMPYMKHLLQSLFFGGIGASLTFSIAFSAPIGHVSDLQGEPAQLAYVRDGQSGFLKVQDSLFFKDQLQTYSQTTARLLLTPDETTHVDLFLYENSTLVLNQPILTLAGKKDFITRFINGLLKIVTRGISDTHRLLIFTDTHLIGVRGSTLWIGQRSHNDSMVSFVILQRGAKVFYVPLKQGRPDWTNIQDLPSTEKFTTVLFKEDGSIDKIIPKWVNPHRIPDLANGKLKAVQKLQNEQGNDCAHALVSLLKEITTEPARVRITLTDVNEEIVSLRRMKAFALDASGHVKTEVFFKPLDMPGEFFATLPAEKDTWIGLSVDYHDVQKPAAVLLGSLEKKDRFKPLSPPSPVSVFNQELGRQIQRKEISTATMTDLGELQTLMVSQTDHAYVMRDQTLKIFWDLRDPASLAKQWLTPKPADFSYFGILDREWILTTDQMTVTLSYPLETLLKGLTRKEAGEIDCEADVLNPRCDP